MPNTNIDEAIKESIDISKKQLGEIKNLSSKIDNTPIVVIQTEDKNTRITLILGLLALTSSLIFALSYFKINPRDYNDYLMIINATITHILITVSTILIILYFIALLVSLSLELYEYNPKVVNL